MELVLDWYQEVNPMADAETLPPNVLNAIASKLGGEIPKALGANLGLLGGGPASLKETFPVWMLEAASILEPTDNLSLLAKNTGHWHHQLASAAGPLAYARSMPLGADPQSWSIRQVSTSDLTTKVNDCIIWVDANIPGNWTTRLLTIPAYHVHAFWFIDPLNPANQEVVVISSPQNHALVTNKIYTPTELLNELRRSSHIKGLA
ncbi:hypothetical protein [Paludisphaera mucosa]|uniref:Uncharacterized protein n=1 Tax=Paludisphaera mucosa TaxID=3030827 RepID=A0ABT6FLL2_9BACT|nr:hypothetical protein [Paludisphaera mucosa]MDG3008449.1 hypothetical protein [Paludisphaera mucosa]